MMDLYHASRDELIRLILAQREIIARQEALLGRQQAELAAAQAANQRLAQRVGELAARVRELEADRGSGKPRGLAGNKLLPAKPPKANKPRKQRRHNVARRRMVPTAQAVHAAERCPDCGSRLCGGVVRRTREVIEIVVAPVTVTEHVYLERRCPRCRRAWVPSEALAGVVVGQQRLGVGLVGLIATLREEGRWPFRLIQWYLATFHQLHLSVGALVGALKRAARHGRGLVDRVREQIRGSPVVHADETGWRQNGANGYVWTFCTTTARYFLRRGRHKEVVDEVLGARFDGVLVCDFYAAYDHYPGVKQRCWAHLLRDIHELREQHPTDAALGEWAAGVHDLYTRAKAYRGATAQERRRAQRACERALLALCPPSLATATAPQATLCRRIAAYLPELFVFVADPAVPSTNNEAERSLRHLVTSRKISGGTRSTEGSDAKLALASLFGTWRAEGRNPFLACLQLLSEPPLPPLSPQR
jgi:transposase